MIHYKIDIMEALKEKGYSSYRIKQEKILSNGTTTKLRNGEYIAFDVLDTLCKLLCCQPGDLIKYEPD